MATYEDLVSVLNNPLGLSLADALAQRNANVSLPTLADKKMQGMSERLAEKQQKIDPNNYQQQFPELYETLHNSGYDNTSISDLAEASLYRAGGNLADVGKTISNSLFGTNFDDSEQTGWSNGQIADDKAGVSLAYRQNMQQDQDQVLQDIVQGNWLDAIASAGNVAFRTAADSFATVPELAAGAALTAVGGAGAGVVGKKVFDAADNAKSIYKRYQDIKDNKVIKGARNVLTETGKASVLTADMVQQIRNDYKAENNGEEMSAGRLAGATALMLASSIVQIDIAKKLFIGKVGKTTKKDGDFRERITKELQSLVDTSNKSITRNLAERIGSGIKNVFAAGGAEAVQEYGQFWAETLSVKMKPDEQTGLFQAALDVFNTEGNADKAIQSAFLGGAAGGATKAAMSTPGNAVGAVFDTGASAVGTVKRKIRENIQENLSDENIFAKSAEYNAKKQASDEFVERTVAKAETINNAKTINDIEDESLINELTTFADGKDLNDPEVFETVKNSAIRNLKSKAAQAEIAIKAEGALNVGEKALKRAAENAEKLTKAVLTPERVEAIKGFAKETVDTIVNEVENFPQSTTAGLIESAGEYAANKSKKGLTALRLQAAKSGIEATKKLAEIVKDDAPDVYKVLTESVRKQENAERQEGLDNDNLSTSETLSPVIRKAASIGVNEETASQTIVDIFEVSKGTFDSENTVNIVRRAIEKVKGTDHYKNMSVNDRTALAAVEAKLKRKIGPKSRTVVEKVKNTYDKVDVGSYIFKDDGGDSALSKVYKAVNDAYVKFTSKNSNEPTETLLLTDKSKLTKESIPDDVIPVTASNNDEVIGGIQKNEFVEGLKTSIAGLGLKTEEQITKFLDNVTVPEKLKGMVDKIGSSDIDTVHAFLSYITPGSETEKVSKYLRGKLESVLNQEEDNNTETEVSTKEEVDTAPDIKVEESKKQEREKFDKLSKEDISKLETVTVDDDTDISSGYEGKLIEVTNEDGTFSYVNVPKSKEELKDLLSIIPVCKI